MPTTVPVLPTAIFTLENILIIKLILNTEKPFRKNYSFSFFKTESGEFLTILMLFPTPKANTKKVIAGRITTNGTHEGVKAVSNNI